MSAIWDRVFSLDVGDSGEVLRLDGFSGEPAQIQFRVTTYAFSPLSLATITVYGLAYASRMEIYNKYDRVTLTAGYRQSFGNIFDGTIYNVSIGRDGPEVYVTLYCRSLGERYDNAFINQTWGGKTPAVDVITSVASTFGRQVELVGDFSTLPPLIDGDTISTGSKQALRQLANRYDFSWHVDSAGTMVIALPGASRDPDNPHRISAETGMIGSPVIKERGIDVLTTMRTEIRTQDDVLVENMTGELGFANPRSARFSNTIGAGRYKAIGVTHVGDMHGDDWSTLIEGLSPRMVESA